MNAAVMSSTHLSASPMIHVRVFTDAITGDPVDVWCPIGSTIAEIVDAIPLPEGREGMRKHYRAWLNEWPVDRGLWHRVRPAAWAEEKPISLVIRMPVRGGRGGGGKLLSIVAAVALISLTAFIGGGGLAGVFGSAFQAGTWGARLAAAGASILGALAIQGLMPKPKKESKDPMSTASASNDFAPFDPLQRVVGRAMVVPQIVVPPFTTLHKAVTKSNRATRYDQSVTVVYGLAGRHQIESITVDGVDAETVSNLEIETREGLSTDAALTFTPDTRIEEARNEQLSSWEIDPDDDSGAVEIIGTIAQSEPKWHTLETKKDVDAAVVEFVLPSGLIFTAASGTRGPAGVIIRARMRRRGTSAWGSYVNLPQLAIRAKEGNDPIRLQLEIRWVDKLPSSAGNQWPTSGAAAGIRDSAKVRGWVASFLPADGTWTSPLYTSSAKAPNARAEWEWESDTRIILYMLKSKYPKGRWQIDLKRSWPINWNYVNLGNYQYHSDAATTYDYFTPPLPASGSMLPRLNYNPSMFQDTITVSMIQSVFYEYPIAKPKNPMTLIALRRKGAPIGRVSVVATGVCSSWNGTTWVANQATTNPADWFRDVLLGVHNAQPVPSGIVDSATLADWHEENDAAGREIGLVVKGMSVPELLSAIALVGHASPNWGRLYGVVMDRPRATFGGLISSRNARGFSYEKAFDKTPHALRVTYRDEADDFAVREIMVYFPGYTAANATLFEQIEYRGIKSEAEAVARANKDIGWRLYRSTILGCEMDFEHVRIERGSRVLWEMDIVGAVTGRGTIVSLTKNGSSQITSIVIDEPQTLVGSDADLWDVSNLWKVSDLWKVGRFGAAIRRQDGAIVVVECTSGATPYDLTLATPLAMPKAGARELIGEGDLLTCGPLSSVSRDVIIIEIAPAGDFTAAISAVDYAGDEIYGG